MNSEDIKKLNKRQLDELASQLQIKGYKRKKKSDLVEIISVLQDEWKTRPTKKLRTDETKASNSSSLQILNQNDFELVPSFTTGEEQEEEQQQQEEEHPLGYEKCECGVYINPKFKLHHFRTHRLHRVEKEFEISAAALEDSVIDLYHHNSDQSLNILEYMESIRVKGVDILEKAKARKTKIKVNFNLNTELKRHEDEPIEFGFTTKQAQIFDTFSLNELWNDVAQNLQVRLETFEGQGSGYIFQHVIGLSMQITSFKPFKGGSFLPLPNCVKSKKAVINVHNQDDKCFMWSILACLHPVERDAERISKYIAFTDELNFSDISFPVELCDIPKFERLNKIKVNVFDCVSEHTCRPGNCKIDVAVLYNSNVDYSRKVNLMLIKKDGKTHYCWIKNMSRLLSRTYSSKKVKSYICERCLYGTKDEAVFSKHVEICKNNGIGTVALPKPGHVEFRKHTRKLRMPFVIYADFECILEQTDRAAGSKTTRYQKHVPSSFAFYVASVYPDAIQEPLRLYRSNVAGDVELVFVREITQIAREIAQLLMINKQMEISDAQLEQHQQATQCFICNCSFTDDNPKVKDHDHYTGQYRGAACNKCNVNFHASLFVPVFFHNLSGYDAHLFIKNLGFDKAKLKVIAENEEKYKSFSKMVLVDEKRKIELRFLDSMKFMGQSLEQLAKNLTPQQLLHARKYLLDSAAIQKGVFPYDYMNSFDRYEEASLPPKEAFYSKLNDSNISSEDYERAKLLFQKFNCKTLGDYSDLYLKTDVLLLADVFENFRSVCLRTYELDPCWYYTTPGLAWDAMLKMTKIRLQTINDLDILFMLEAGIRGGMSEVSHRYAKAENKYLSNEGVEKSNYIIYLDANNLYGWALSKPLPYDELELLTDVFGIEIKNLKYGTFLEFLKGKSELGYMLEVDLEYPAELHDSHNDMPLAPVKGRPSTSKCEKLLLTLNNKTNYVVYYKTLIKYVELGLKVIRFHRILQFKEKAFIKEYIDLNTQLRDQAQNVFEKNFYKLMNNSVYGKTMENVRNHKLIELVSDAKTMMKLAQKVNFSSRKILGEDLVVVQMHKRKIVFNKPIYIGVCVLDLSKLLMYDFHYNVMKQKYKEGITLLYKDTDSFIYNVRTEDIYKDMMEMHQHFDTSNYNLNHFLYSTANKGVIGVMKDEMAGNLIKEFVALRAKCYAMVVQVEEHDEEVKRAKGIKKSVVKKDIHFEDYKTVLLNMEKKVAVQSVFTSDCHTVFTQQIEKKALTFFDDKRVLMDDGITSLALGHWRNEVVEEHKFHS